MYGFFRPLPLQIANPHTQGILSGTASVMNATKHEANKSTAIPLENSWITKSQDSSGDTETLYLHILDRVETAGGVIFFTDGCVFGCEDTVVPFTRPTVKGNILWLQKITVSLLK